MNKERTNIKREFALKEREHLLKEVENVEAVLRGELSPEDVAGLWIRLNTKLSFSESVSWLQPLIEDGLSDIQGRLEKIVDALEREFSTSYSVGNQSEEELEKFIRRSKAYSIVRLYIDSALILYVLGRNGAALIDLHAAVERQAIESLSKHILSPERAEIVGGLLGGKRGAGVGALLGGGGATAAWLLKNRNDRRRLGRYGQPIATIGTGTALGAGVGALVRGKRGALIGAALGGGGTAAAYLLTNRNRRPRYAYNNGGSYAPARRYYTSNSRRRTRARRSCRC
jgi:hypothetical protein